MSEWYDALDTLRATVWTRVAEGGLVSVATTGPDGGARVRTQILRDARADRAEVDLHTDAQSAKVSEIANQPLASILLWDDDLQLQIRLRGPVTVTAGDAAADTWRGVPEASRGNYGVRPAPGTPIGTPDGYERRPSRDRFAVLTLRVDEIDAVVLAPDHHRRALYARAGGFAGRWLAP